MKENKFEKIITYIYILCAIEFSGNLVFIATNQIKYNIVFMIFSVLYGIFVVGHIRIQKDNFLVLIIISLLLVCSMVLGINENISSYFNLIFTLVLALIFATNISIEKFSSYYINIIAFFSMCSLIFWIIGLIMPQFYNFFSSFPNLIMEFEDTKPRTYVNVFYLHTYIVQYGFGTGVITGYPRNNGIFWEPGAYQFFLVLAMILLNESPIDKNKKFLFNILFTATVFTTGSTTGLLCLLILLFVYMIMLCFTEKKFESSKLQFISMLLIIISIPIIINLIPSLMDIFDKIQSETSKTGYISDRTGFAAFDYILANIKTLLFGYGVAGRTALTVTTHNTYLYYALIAGLPLAVIFLIALLMNLRKCFVHYICAWIVIMLSFSSENYILYFLPLSALFWHSNDYIEYGP